MASKIDITARSGKLPGLPRTLFAMGQALRSRIVARATHALPVLRQRAQHMAETLAHAFI